MKNLSDAGLYAILDSTYIPHHKLPETAKKIVDGGCSIIQYRDKNSAKSDILRNALKIKKCLPSSVVFIINDHVDVAKDTGADGVHLGQEDDLPGKARDMLGRDALIGLSTHSLDQALKSNTEPVNYIGFGPIYKTLTKPDYIPVGEDNILAVKKQVQRPVFAIGGISLENLESVLKMRPDGVSIVSALLTSDDIEKTTRMILHKIRTYKKAERTNESKKK